ncbi:MAG: hypothetical protein VX498_14260 [Myxococcota bacterium]|nr:hypothetical protein [Myxococcota bacterium]
MTPEPSRIVGQASGIGGQRRVVATCILLLCIAIPLLASAHRHVDAWAPRSSALQRVKYLPTGDFLRTAALGYEMLLADFFWIRATLLFGENHGKADQDWYAWLYHMIDLTTDLDPEFRAAYKYGGTMLRVDGVFVDQSSLVFQKGMRNRPDEWYFPFGIAMNYFIHRENSEVAARYMEVAATTGGGPFYLRNLTASLLSESNQLDAALLFAQEELNNLPAGHTEIRSALELKVFELKYLVGVQAIERVLQQHRASHGAFPESPADLEATIVDPLGGFWEWDPSEDAAPGKVRSSRYCEVFVERSKKASLGRLSVQECPEQQ